MSLTEILKAIKENGIILVLLVASFIYFQGRITALEQKYEFCMNERIEDAIKQRDFNRTFGIERRAVAILPDKLKIIKA